MDLWIRSQDKLTMLKVNDIKIIDYRGLKEQIEKSSVFSLLGNMEQMKGYIDKDGWGLNCNNTCMGIYETKERALEVLDEIHSCIQTNAGFEMYSNLGQFSDDFNKKYNLVPVYLMPKE